MEDRNIREHQYKDLFVKQSTDDATIQGQSIPKGYVFATNILAIASELAGKRKEWAKYYKSENTQEFLEELSLENGQPILNKTDAPYGASAQPRSLQPLVVVIKGGHPELQGIWVHLEIALHLAQWASPRFAVWANKTLRLVLQGDFVARTDEARIQTKAEIIAEFRESLFGYLNNAEYIELATECRADHAANSLGW